MKALQIARGGMLVGAAVVLLYLACVIPPGRWGFCVAAGITVAVPLAFGWIRMGVLVYLASGMLSLLMLPDKRYALCYLALTGLYPLVKFAAERTGKLVLEILIKFLFISVVAAAVILLAASGFVPALAERLHEVAWYWLILPFYLIYAAADTALSRVIAMVRVLLSRK